MDIENRKTTLDDNAEIYNRKTDTVSKEDLKNLTLRQKMGYFRDYYLVAVAAILVAAVFIAYFVYTLAINPSKEVLSVTCLNKAYVTDTEALGNAIKEYLGIEREKDYVGANYYDTSDYQMNVAYMTIAGAGSMDLIICTYDEFQRQANLGMLADMREFLPPETYERLEDRMCMGKIIEADIDGTVTYVGEEAPYGIDISDSKVCGEYIVSSEKTVLCAFAAPPNRENALKAIDFFVEK